MIIDKLHQRGAKLTLCITIYHQGDLDQKIVSRSDEAPYEAKENGRNRVEYKW